MPNETTTTEVQLAQSREAEVRQRHVQYVEALVGQIHTVRRELDEKVARLQETASELRSVCRRNFDEASSSYLIFANSHLRLAGALSQGIKRTASMDRVLVNANREREDAKVREAEFKRQQAVRAHGKLVEKLQLPTDDGFDELFGEIVDDASE